MSIATDIEIDRDLARTWGLPDPYPDLEDPMPDPTPSPDRRGGLLAGRLVGLAVWCERHDVQMGDVLSVSVDFRGESRVQLDGERPELWERLTSGLQVTTLERHEAERLGLVQHEHATIDGVHCVFVRRVSTIGATP